jgi:tRNA U34 2-thiouridine synthase MnmA/TrmU
LKSRPSRAHSKGKHLKALALLSGGLDSALAAALLTKEGADIEGVFFHHPFYPSKSKSRFQAEDVAESLNIRLKTIEVEELIEVVKKPKHGYGRGLNPCIDCRIFMLKKAKKHAKKIGASLIITGEVLDERPMSQHRRALDLIERESGLEGRILRPLSAKLLPETEAERSGLIDRDKMLDIRGRPRRRQLELAKDLGITGYASPAGGCLLTEKHFVKKLRDLFKHTENVKARNIELLKAGRHFRKGRNKIVVGRDEDENTKLLNMKGNGDYCFEVPECGSPTTLLLGPKSKEAIETAASLTAYYSDNKNDQTIVAYGIKRLDKTINVHRISEEEINKLRVA